MVNNSPTLVHRCGNWQELTKRLAELESQMDVAPGEELWFRGVNDAAHQLLPSLLWRAPGLSDEALDDLEQRLFFEFQARARELHERSLSDWDYLFFMRHHGVPTRLLDWTDSFGRAIFFALDALGSGTPCVWVLNPYALNGETWYGGRESQTARQVRDLVQPKYLTYVDGEFWEYGEALIEPHPWTNDGPVAIYPLQISDRMRAQQGWFTFHGNDRSPLEQQLPGCVARLDLVGDAIVEARRFLQLAGLRPYAVYPDLDHLGREVWEANLGTIAARRAGGR